ncbi:MAG TPA: preprotein translocase subunit SecE [Micromonosporaceae bacterium]|nr:preprotein translocase subunit SecE [Micromonosporaceae bacterium]
MAESKRRSKGPANQPIDEELSNAEDVVDIDDEDEAERDATLVRSSRSSAGQGGRTTTRERPRAERPAKKEGERLGIFGRIGRFVREVVAELRKVIWPTRKELLTYTVVVVVFVSVMLTIVGLLDLGFAKAVLWVFGNPNNE